MTIENHNEHSDLIAGLHRDYLDFGRLTDEELAAQSKGANETQLVIIDTVNKAIMPDDYLDEDEMQQLIDLGVSEKDLSENYDWHHAWVKRYLPYAVPSQGLLKHFSGVSDKRKAQIRDVLTVISYEDFEEGLLRRVYETTFEKLETAYYKDAYIRIHIFLTCGPQALPLLVDTLNDSRLDYITISTVIDRIQEHAQGTDRDEISQVILNLASKVKESDLDLYERCYQLLIDWDRQDELLGEYEQFGNQLPKEVFDYLVEKKDPRFLPILKESYLSTPTREWNHDSYALSQPAKAYAKALIDFGGPQAKEVVVDILQNGDEEHTRYLAWILAESESTLKDDEDVRLLVKD